MRPAEIKKRAMDPLYSERLLEEALSDISENAHARKLQHVEPHPGRGTTTRRAAFHFVVLKILQDFSQRRRPPIGGSRFKNSTNFSDCNNKMTFFAKKVVISVFPRVSVGRIGALRRQSAAIPGEGLHSNVRPSLAAHCGMYCKGECSDESRCFDFAPKGAPLNMTAKAVTPSEVEGSRGRISKSPCEPHRRKFGELETFRLRYRSAQGDRNSCHPEWSAAESRDPEGRESYRLCKSYGICFLDAGA